MNKREFAKVVQAWAEGETIQWTSSAVLGEWGSLSTHEAPAWRNVQFLAVVYRIKPKDVTEYRYAHSSWSCPHVGDSDVKLTFTNGKLTNVEVIND